MVKANLKGVLSLGALISIAVSILLVGFAIKNAADVILQSYSTGGCMKITQSGTYKLDRDISGAKYLVSSTPWGDVKACIYIEASDVTLDCQGHHIKVPNKCFGVGVYVKRGAKNVIIKNCKIDAGCSERMPGGALFTNLGIYGGKCVNTYCRAYDGSYIKCCIKEKPPGGSWITRCGCRYS